MQKLFVRLATAVTALLVSAPAIAQVDTPRPATTINLSSDTPVCYMETDSNQLINLENLCGQRSPQPTVAAFNCNRTASGNYINSNSGGGSVYVPADVRKGEAYERQSQCG
ncbi:MULTISPECIES: hypothetical protein [Trichocoleus]|uniref:Uncharacterized protein n=1 Tax=Trichocoleus desertorum GB2-A4 TaxID=2933944 RepID=A0ABV0JA35_9CYAN|nr:hypothetical protein [Trichocoleus sp. FACHB-46]MBD1861350.1 hypothetical protein [Trichocoleus sp. FACHB-46]